MKTHPQGSTTDAPHRELVTRWQRVVVGASTCERCGDTGESVRKAAARLAGELAPQGVVVRVEEKALPPFAVAESNRVFFNGEPLEVLLGAKAGMSHCQSCCDLLGQQPDCRTLILGGQEHEALPEEQILRAGHIAAQRLSTEHKETV